MKDIEENKPRSAEWIRGALQIIESAIGKQHSIVTWYELLHIYRGLLAQAEAKERIATEKNSWWFVTGSNDGELLLVSVKCALTYRQIAGLFSVYAQMNAVGREKISEVFEAATGHQGSLKESSLKESNMTRLTAILMQETPEENISFSGFFLEGKYGGAISRTEETPSGEQRIRLLITTKPHFETLEAAVTAMNELYVAIRSAASLEDDVAPRLKTWSITHGFVKPTE